MDTGSRRDTDIDAEVDSDGTRSGELDETGGAALTGRLCGITYSLFRFAALQFEMLATSHSLLYCRAVFSESPSGRTPFTQVAGSLVRFSSDIS